MLKQTKSETAESPLTFPSWLETLGSRLAPLDRSKQLAFAACCCERQVPYYYAFFKGEHWGNPTVIAAALDFIWARVPTNSPVNSKAQQLIVACQAAAPDTEDFESLFTSSALNAASSLAESIAFVVDGYVEHIVSVSSLIWDSIDGFVQQMLDENDGISEFEPHIDQHPLMVEELRKQQRDLREIGTKAVLTKASALELRANARLAAVVQL